MRDQTGRDDSSNSLLKNTNSRPDRNVWLTFFNDPEASGGTDISVCAFFNRLLTRFVEFDPAGVLWAIQGSIGLDQPLPFKSVQLLMPS